MNKRHKNKIRTLGAFDSLLNSYIYRLLNSKQDLKLSTNQGSYFEFETLTHYKVRVLDLD